MTDLIPTLDSVVAQVRPSPRAPSLWRAGISAALLSAGANALLYLAGSQHDLFPQYVLVPGQNVPITFARVVTMTVLGVALGVLVFALMRRRMARPYPAFRLVALVALLLSYTQPSMVLHNAPLRMVVALNVLHTVAAALTVLTLGRTER